MLEFSLGFRGFTFDPKSDQSYRKQRRLYNSELTSTVLKSNGTSLNVKKWSCSNESNSLSLQVEGDSLKIITECCKRGIMSMTDIIHIDSLYFLYTERTSNNRWENTPAHGYCAFISLAQLYLLYIQNNMIQRSEACILDRALHRNDMHDWIVRSIGNNVINSGFDLRNYQHQQDFEIWLLILINWSNDANLTTRLKLIKNKFSLIPSNANNKHQLKRDLWEGSDMFRNLKIPFKFYELGPSMAGGTFKLIYSQNIIEPNNSNYYSINELLTIMACSYVLIGDGSHFYMNDDFTIDYVPLRVAKLKETIQIMMNSFQTQSLDPLYNINSKNTNEVIYLDGGENCSDDSDRSTIDRLITSNQDVVIPNPIECTSKPSVVRLTSTCVADQCVKHPPPSSYATQSVINRKTLTASVSTSSNVVQQIIPANPDLEYIIGVSYDSELKIRIEKRDIIKLSPNELVSLYQSPASFIFDSAIPLLQIYKRMKRSSVEPDTEMYFRNTTPNGYCMPVVFKQLHSRFVNQSPTNRCPPTTNLNIQDQRLELIEFIEEQLINKSITKNEDIIRLKVLQNLLRINSRSLDSDKYLGIENIHLYTFPFPVTCWSHTTQDEDFLSMVYTNRLGLHHNLLSCQVITTHEYKILSTNPNDFHQHKNHFYIVPTYDTWETRKDRLRNTLISMEPNIRRFVQSINQPRNSSSEISHKKSESRLADEVANIKGTSELIALSITKNSLIRQLKTGIMFTPSIYPSLVIRNNLKHLLSRTRVEESKVCTGKGLYSNSRDVIQKNEIIGVYGGSPTEQRNPYTMKIYGEYEIGQCPTEETEWSKFGYINDYIWDQALCNCKIEKYGIITTTKPIQMNEELFMSYGIDYDWSEVKLSYHNSLLGAIIKMRNHIMINTECPEISLISETYKRCLDDPNQKQFHQLLADFFEGTVESPSVRFQSYIHLCQPHYDGNVYNWIVNIITCDWFYKQQCFRKHMDPNQKISKYTLIKPASSGLRKSDRLQRNTIINYSNQLEMEGFQLHNSTVQVPSEYEFCDTDTVNPIVKVAVKNHPEAVPSLRNQSSNVVDHSCKLKGILGVGPSKTIKVTVEPSFFAQFSRCENSQQVYDLLCHSSVPMLSLKKIRLKSSLNTKSSYQSMFIALYSSQMRELKEPQSISYTEWLDDQLKSVMLSSKIHSHLLIAKQRSPIAVMSNSQPLSSHIDELVIRWRTTFWECQEDDYAIPCWTNVLSSHFRESTCSNLFTHQQIIKLLSNTNDTEHSGSNHYLLPVTETTSLIKEYRDALLTLATNLYNILIVRKLEINPSNCPMHTVPDSTNGSKSNLQDPIVLADEEKQHNPIVLSNNEITSDSCEDRSSCADDTDSFVDQVRLRPHSDTEPDTFDTNLRPAPMVQVVEEYGSGSGERVNYSEFECRNVPADHNSFNSVLLDNLADQLCKPSYRHHPKSECLSAMIFNAGSSNEEKRIEIYDIIKTTSIDVTIILDTGVTMSNISTYKHHAKKWLGTAFITHFVPTTVDDNGKAIGSAIVIISKREQNINIKSLVCVGAVVQVEMSFGQLQITVFGMYYPRYNVNPGSYLAKISGILNIPIQDVHKQIHRVLQEAIIDAQNNNRQIIVMADFNVNLSRGSTDFDYLFQDLHLVHAANKVELEQSSYQQGNKESRIDFTLYQGDSITPKSSTCVEYATYNNDHTPVLTVFHVKGHSAPFEPHMTKPGVPRFNYSNKSERQRFEKMCKVLDPRPEESFETRLDNITKDTVDIARKLTPVKKANRGFKYNDWCPQNKVIAIARAYLIRIRRHCHGNKKYMKWSESGYAKSLKKIKSQWSRDIKKVGKSVGETEELLVLVPYGPHYWNKLELDDIKRNIPIAIIDTHKMASNQLKRQRRLEFLEFSRNREYLYQIQSIGSPIQSILHNIRSRYAMEDIMDQGKRITAPGVLLQLLTNNFKEWFEAQGSFEDDPTFLNNSVLFFAMTDSENIPRSIASNLWESIREIPKVSILSEELTTMPTYLEYKRQIDKASIQSAGGMSGMTYGMMKAWPDEIHESVYNALCQSWSAKDIPNSWKWRWLLPLPKVPDPLISQLRPLCLLEVIRKLWSKIFVQRISTFIEKQEMLHPGQHSSRGKGTESAVLEFAAALETAKELKTDIFISSWDIKRAYDSVQRRFLLFSWIRVGVPAELALYLVSMDYGGQMVVQAPLAMAVFDKLGYEGLKQHNINFSPDQGTAQGGVDSSLVFSAFLDILLHAISRHLPNDDAFFLSDVDGTIIRSESIAYVDDLICSTGSALGLQKVADMVSAFCIVFRLQLNTEKFRAFSVSWGNPMNQISSMLIHTEKWVPVTVQLQRDGTMKHLGVRWDMSLDNEIMYQEIRSHVQKLLDYIVRSKASTQIKLCAINVSLMTSIVYECKFTTWSLQKYKCIDLLFQKAYRKISLNQAAFPTLLLYADKNQLGLEFTQFSTRVQEAKLHMFQRSIYNQCRRRQSIMNSLTARVVRQMGCQPSRHGAYQLKRSTDKLIILDNYSWWFSSLSEHMANMEITLERASITVEITNQQTTDSQIEHLSLRQGQVWLKHEVVSNLWQIIEITGFISDSLMTTIPWSITDMKNGTPNRITMIGGSSWMLGSGSTHNTNYDEFFTGSQAVYYITTLRSIQYKSDCNVSRCGDIHEKIPYISTRSQQSSHNIWFQDIQSELLVHTHTIKQRSTLYHNSLDSNNRTVTCLIKTDKDNTKHCLKVRQLQQHPNILTSQIASIHIATSMSCHRRQTFVVTSKSGISAHRQAMAKPCAHPAAVLLATKKGHRVFPLPSSVEQDKLVKSIEEDTTVNVTITVCDDSEWSLNLKRSNNGVLTQNGSLVVQNYKDITCKYQHKQYLMKRDIYRGNVMTNQGVHDYDPAYWTESNTWYASLVIKNVKIGAFRCFITRVVYDWHQTGRNILKRDPEDVFAAKCLLCGAHLEDQLHIIWKCSHKYMQECRLHHLSNNKKYIDGMNQKAPSTIVSRDISNALKCHQNWELTLGRVHKRHKAVLDRWKCVHQQLYVTQLTMFFNMVLCLYSVRKQVMQEMVDAEQSVTVITIDQEQLRVRIGENLLGIGSNTAITAAGERITRAMNASPDERIVSHKRKVLNPNNSIFLKNEQNRRDKLSQIMITKDDNIRIKRIRKEDVREWSLRYDSMRRPSQCELRDIVQTVAEVVEVGLKRAVPVENCGCVILPGIDIAWNDQTTKVDMSMVQINKLLPEFSLLSGVTSHNNSNRDDVKVHGNRATTTREKDKRSIGNRVINTKKDNYNRCMNSREQLGSITRFLKPQVTRVKVASQGDKDNESEVLLDLTSQRSPNDKVNESENQKQQLLITQVLQHQVTTVKVANQNCTGKEGTSLVLKSADPSLAKINNKRTYDNLPFKQVVDTCLILDQLPCLEIDCVNIDAKQVSATVDSNVHMCISDELSSIRVDRIYEESRGLKMVKSEHHTIRDDDDKNTSLPNNDVKQNETMVQSNQASEEHHKRCAVLQITSYFAKARAIEGCSPGVPGGRTGQG